MKTLAEIKHKNLKFICAKCGQRIYNKCTGVATWHYQLCDACNEFKPCTELKDFTEELK